MMTERTYRNITVIFVASFLFHTNSFGEISKEPLLKKAAREIIAEKAKTSYIDYDEDQMFISMAKDIAREDGIDVENSKFSVSYLNDTAIVSFEAIHEPTQLIMDGCGQITFKHEGEFSKVLDKAYCG